MPGHMAGSSHRSCFASVRHDAVTGVHGNTFCDALGCVSAGTQAG
jgi:hypothetical protein